MVVCLLPLVSHAHEIGARIGGAKSQGLTRAGAGAQASMRGAGRKAARKPRGVGFHWSGAILADISHGIQGGLNDNTTLAQYLLDLRATVKTARLLGWPGGTFFVDFQDHHGPSVQVRQIGSIQDPDNMDAYATTGIDRAWYQQDLAGRRLRLRVGLMYVDDQFLTVPYARDFVSLDFSSDASLSTFVLPTYPRGAFGADLFIYPTRSLYLAAGLFNGHLYRVLPYDPGGRFFITQAGYKGHIAGLPGVLELGAWRHTGTFPSFAGGVQHRAQGWYLVAGLTLFRSRKEAANTERKVGVFFQYGAGPPTVALIRRHMGAGIVWRGAFPGRPRDSLGLGVSEARLTPEAGLTFGSETVYEAYYRLFVARSLSIEPDLQYWHHPGGNGTPSALLALIRTQWNF